MRRTGLFLLFAILTPMWIAASGERKPTATGTITGTVTDKETGRPVTSASVLVVGTAFGAQTDLDGRYRIDNVAPGSHLLRFSHVEYRTVELAGVEVAEGSTAVRSVALEKNGAVKSDVRILGTKDKLGVPESSSQAPVTKEEIPMYRLPAEDQALRQPPDAAAAGHGVEIFMRGGRAGEAEYITRENSLPPAHGGSAIVNGQPYDAMFFRDYGVNPFVDTDDDHLSTFAVDVDDASYIMTRSYLQDGHLPPAEAVRTEEFINHFTYDYDPPRRETFRVYADGAPSLFGEKTRLLRIGIKGREIDPEERKPATLVFVIDVSGSMARENRLGLVKQSLRYLVDQLLPDDRVGIVVYGSSGRVLLEPTGAGHRTRILRVIDGLEPGGSTNAEEGLRLGYRMADRNFVRGQINRIILCSDGVANVGKTGPEEILRDIRRYAERGITLTAVGFGMGNYNDVLMEQLGNKGDGFYAYVDDAAEARRVFIDNLTGNLQVIARDVKIQVEFDPRAVRSYRLLGYENRDVADRDFRNDAVDGGEVGAGHQVTALYEIKLWSDGNRRDKHAIIDRREDDDGARPGDLGIVRIRYKDPDRDRVAEITGRITDEVFDRAFAEADPDFRLAAAAAEFAEILRHSYWARDSRLSDVIRVAHRVRSETGSEEAAELADLIARAMHYEDELAER